jgi:hypothetical protein
MAAFLRTDYTYQEKNISSDWVLFQKISRNTTIACGDTEFEIAKKIGPSLLVRNGITINEVQKYSITHNNSTLTMGGRSNNCCKKPSTV